MLILASNSITRRNLLQAAGVSFQVQSPKFDEDNAKQSKPDAGPAGISLYLAQGKALALSATNFSDHIIGSDQVLECQGKIYSKPSSPEEARLHLQSLRGRKHNLCTSVALAFQQEVLWFHTEIATMEMRQFSDDFLDSYLLNEGSEILGCVGAYKFEGLGIQLFHTVEGNFHSILGLPLLPLLQELRKHGLISR